MNGRHIRCRGLQAVTIAVALLAGSVAFDIPALAQMAKEKAKAAAGETQTPAATYSQLLKIVTMQVISAAEAMPADKYDFAPTSGNFTGVRTFGSQVQHLAEANYYFFSGFGLTGAPDDAKLKSLKGKDELVKALKDSYEFAQKGIDTITPQNAFQVTGSGPMGMSMTRAGAASFCMAHSMDHYGQMVEYLRMNSIVPPASQPKKK